TSFLTSSVPLLHLHSFPTRRSSDLRASAANVPQVQSGQNAEHHVGGNHGQSPHAARNPRKLRLRQRRRGQGRRQDVAPIVRLARSEEHTSELQSLRHLVCRLLLEKK